MLSPYLVRLAASKVSASKYKLPTRRATTLDVPPQRTDNIFVHTLAPSRSRLLPASLSISPLSPLPPLTVSQLLPLHLLRAFLSTLPLGSRPIARRLPYGAATSVAAPSGHHKSPLAVYVVRRYALTYRRVLGRTELDRVFRASSKRARLRDFSRVPIALSYVWNSVRRERNCDHFHRRLGETNAKRITTLGIMTEKGSMTRLLNATKKKRTSAE